MKLVRLMIVGLMLAGAGALAADTQGKKKPKDSPTTRPSQRPAAKTIRGTILFVDVEAKTLKIEVQEKQKQTSERVVTTDEKTEITLNGEPVVLADLRAGMSVRVTAGDTGPASRVMAKIQPKLKNEKHKNSDDSKGDPRN